MAHEWEHDPGWFLLRLLDIRSSSSRSLLLLLLLLLFGQIQFGENGISGKTLQALQFFGRVPQFTQIEAQMLPRIFMQNIGLFVKGNALD